ncbi:hypothetical protein EDB92DRAFT_1834643 [Lactarius akahatsu]|uniref:Pali-domain-containing protein n=1 Tax=Lactarius akahatsu TaxID=416441 RepID=A0AAD4LRE1_9AGAM|nr:hypothetical protein EDB92DRAFT_1834643 [Lactarius akahatsu]
MAPHLFPGIFFLFSAFILSLLVSISLPGIPTVDIARTHFTGGAAPHIATNTESIEQIRFGIWAYCTYDQTGDRTCVDSGHGYTVHLLSASKNITIGPGATRGLAVHPVAAGVTSIALLCSFSSHVTLVLIASLLSFLAALLTLIAFAIDLSLYVIVRDRVNHFDNVSARSVAAPGFWMTLVSLILLLLAGCAVYFGRRHSRMSGAIDYDRPVKPGLFSCFRRF